MEKGLLLIINPNSGKGNLDKKISEVVHKFEGIGYIVNKVYAKEEHSAYNIIKKYMTKTDLIVCCGGDGTLNEIVNVIVKLNLKVKLSFIPIGTMNDYGKTLGISKKQLFSQKHYTEMKVIPVDIGKFNEKCFNYVAAFGAFTEVSYKTPQYLKRIVGKFAYFIVAIKYLFKIKSYPMNLNIEGNDLEGEFLYGSISNSESIAGFKWFKKAEIKLNDGKFELLLVRKPKHIMQVFKILVLLLTKQYKEPYFVYRQVSSISIKTKEEIKWTLDGEEGEKTKEVEVQNIQKRMEYAILYNNHLK